ncbi:hypothetical protein MXE49_26345, partial [Escherichia coli]|uniref:hypothetical protein n=2 Tax=Escherichia coli TaxID=562 RepID=UPI001BDBA662
SNQRQNGSRQAVSDFCVHGYLSGFIGSESLDMLSLQPASGGHWRKLNNARWLPRKDNQSNGCTK